MSSHYLDQGTLLREDVLELIRQITPEDTPFYNMIGDGSTQQPLHQWNRRAITTRQDNAQFEGRSYTSFPEAIQAARELNITQILDKLIRVSRTSQSSARYGVRDEMSDQTKLRFAEFKTDIEHALIRGSLASGNGSNAARRMRGLIWALSLASQQHSLSSANDTASASTFNEESMNVFLQDLWTVGAHATDVLVNGNMKRRISSFTASSTKFVDMENKRRVNVVSVYESDFQTVEIRLSRDVPQALGSAGISYVICFNPEMFSKAWLDRPFTEPLAKTADTTDAVVVGELCLEYGHPSAGGWVTGV